MIILRTQYWHVHSLLKRKHRVQCYDYNKSAVCSHKKSKAEHETEENESEQPASQVQIGASACDVTAES